MYKPLFFFLSLSFFSMFQSQAKHAPNPVLDVNGTIVQQGFKYYVVPLDPDQAGLGFNLFSIGAENRCPKSVFQAEPYYWGCLIAFHPVNPNNEGVIRESTDLNVEIFYDKYTTPCPNELNFWKVNDDPSGFDVNRLDNVTRYITTGGENGNHGRQTLYSRFKIVKTETAYKFVYCPSVCDDDCKVVCQDVGVIDSDNRLVLSDTPFEFTLRRPETLENIGIPVKLDVSNVITSCNCDTNSIQTIS